MLPLDINRDGLLAEEPRSTSVTADLPSQHPEYPAAISPVAPDLNSRSVTTTVGSALPP